MSNPTGSAVLPFHLEPLTIGGIMDRSFKIYAQHLPVLLSITFVTHIPSLLINLLNVLVLANPEEAVESGMGFAALMGVLMGMLSLVVVLLVVQPLATGAVTQAISQLYLGKSPDAMACFQQAFDRIGRLLFSQLMVGIWVTLGFMLLIVPGIVWMVTYVFVVPIVMLEPPNRFRSSADVLARSKELTVGDRGRLFNLLALVGLIPMATVGVASALATVFQGESTVMALIGALVQELVTLFVAPIGLIANVLAYYDMRIRREGFDIEMLQQAMNASAGNPLVR